MAHKEQMPLKDLGGYRGLRLSGSPRLCAAAFKSHDHKNVSCQHFRFLQVSTHHSNFLFMHHMTGTQDHTAHTSFQATWRVK
jgi:hypothetical protein